MSRRSTLVVGAVVVIAVAPGFGVAAAASPAAQPEPRAVEAAQASSIKAVSVRPSGKLGSGESSDPSLSQDGRFITFHSYDQKLVRGEKIKTGQVYLRDLATRTTTLVSVSSAGEPANSDTRASAVSADGTKVIFESLGTNLAEGEDTNETWDVFLHDTVTGDTVRVSRSPNGDAPNEACFNASVSADGTKITFQSEASDVVRGDTNGATDVFVFDTVAQKTTLVSKTWRGKPAAGHSFAADISADGTTVTFQSGAEDLVPEDGNDDADVFVVDLATQAIELITRDDGDGPSDGGSFFPSISADGAVVAYMSYASDLVPGDDNGTADVFRWRAGAGSTELLSRAPDGDPANGPSSAPSLSGDGTRAAYESSASDLVGGDTNGLPDVFSHDTTTGITRLVSQARGGGSGDRYSINAIVAPDGRSVAFTSAASDLVRRDANGVSDVFLARWP